MSKANQGGPAGQGSDSETLRAASPSAEERAEALGEVAAERGFVTHEDFCSAIRAAEVAARAEERRIRDAAWTMALGLSHYDAIDGLHLDCVSCAPLSALLTSAASAAQPPPKDHA